MSEKKDRKFEILKKEFLKSIKYFSELEEKYQIKADTISSAHSNHYTNLINELLQKQTIKKYLEKINIDTKYNNIKKDKVDLYGVCTANIRIDEEASKDKVVQKMVKRILGKLVKKELEKQFWYIISLYQFYYNVMKEYNLYKYYYYYYYKNNMLAKHKELTEEEILILLDKLFKNSNDFLDYFWKLSNKIKYKIADFLELTSAYIQFFKEFRKSKYIWKNGEEKERIELQLVWLKWNYIEEIPIFDWPWKEERNKVLKRNYELMFGKKIDNIDIRTYYLKKIKVQKEWDKKIILLDDFIKSIKRSIKNLLFIDNLNIEFFYKNLYKVLLYYRQKAKWKEIEINSYADILDLNWIKTDVLEKHKKNLNYIFNIKDFILVNDDILQKVINIYLDTTDWKLNSLFEKYILDHISKISINKGIDIDVLIENIEKKQDYWFNDDFNILSVNKQIKKNIFNYLKNIVDISDYKLNYNISIYL